MQESRVTGRSRNKVAIVAGSARGIGAAEAAPKAAVSYNTVYVWGIASVAALGGLLFGYDWVVIGGAKPFYEAYFDLTSPQLIGWANSCALVGCLLGSMVCSSLSERLGR